jgi:hypothetical protein
VARRYVNWRRVRAIRRTISRERTAVSGFTVSSVSSHVDRLLEWAQEDRMPFCCLRDFKTHRLYPTDREGAADNWRA